MQNQQIGINYMIANMGYIFYIIITIFIQPTLIINQNIRIIPIEYHWY